MTPNVAIVHVQNPSSRGIHLWIPLFFAVDSSGTAFAADLSGCGCGLSWLQDQLLEGHRGLLGHLMQSARHPRARAQRREPGRGANSLGDTRRTVRFACLKETRWRLEDTVADG